MCIGLGLVGIDRLFSPFVALIICNPSKKVGLTLLIKLLR